MWSLDFNNMGAMFGEEPAKTESKAVKPSYKINRTRKKELGEMAHKAAKKYFADPEDVREIKKTGEWYSPVTGKSYRGKSRAISAGKRSQIMTKKYIEKNYNEFEKEFLEEKLDKATTTLEYAKKRKELRKWYKELGKSDEEVRDIMKRNSDRSKVDELYRSMENYKANPQDFGDDTEEEEVWEEWENFDEDEWIEVEKPKRVKRTKELNDIPVYWEDFDGMIIQNPWAWEHGSGSWLYIHGYDYWDLNKLLFDLDNISRDNHTSREFIEYALSHIPRLCKYILDEAENGEWHIYYK